MQNANATPEQARILSDLLDEWEGLLKEHETRPAPDRNLLEPSRRILENYRRTLKLDSERGIEAVPASELFRAISTANASIEKLKGLE